MKQIHLCIIIAAIVMSSGCGSVPLSTDFFLAPVDGKIFDDNNEPCPDVAISVDNGAPVKSDINGRFVIPSLSKGTHTIKITKEGYEEHIQSFSFSNRNQILWLTITSLNQLVRQIEKAFDDKKWDDIESLIDRALKIKPNDPVTMYLQALYYNQNDWIDQAVEVLEKIITNGYSEPMVFLTLADIYQYKLKNRDKAIENLKKYLDLKIDDSTFKRLESLTKAQS
jgi:tetratricopeptide (TPR) repeat protein